MLMFEMLAGRSPFDVVGSAENPDQNTEDYLFQGLYHLIYIMFKGLCYRKFICQKFFMYVSSLIQCAMASLVDLKLN